MYGAVPPVAVALNLTWVPTVLEAGPTIVTVKAEKTGRIRSADESVSNERIMTTVNRAASTE